jgi:endonuclease V-like protein UPF0215 family
MSAPPEYEPGFNVWRAKKLKETVDVPVIAVGRFTDSAGNVRDNRNQSRRRK